MSQDPTQSSFEAPVAGRLDQLLAKQFSVSANAARRHISEGKVKVAGKRAAKGTWVQAGQRIEVEGLPSRTTESAPVAEPELALQILYQDETLLALDKPSGWPTHPLLPEERGTLANALVARFPECATASDDRREAGIAHRLDIAVALLESAHAQRSGSNVSPHGYGRPSPPRAAASHSSPVGRRTGRPRSVRRSLET